MGALPGGYWPRLTCSTVWAGLLLGFFFSSSLSLMMIKDEIQSGFHREIVLTAYYFGVFSRYAQARFSVCAGKRRKSENVFDSSRSSGFFLIFQRTQVNYILAHSDAHLLTLKMSKETLLTWFTFVMQIRTAQRHHYLYLFNYCRDISLHYSDFPLNYL